MGTFGKGKVATLLLFLWVGGGLGQKGLGTGCGEAWERKGKPPWFGWEREVRFLFSVCGGGDLGRRFGGRGQADRFGNGFCVRGGGGGGKGTLPLVCFSGGRGAEGPERHFPDSFGTLSELRTWRLCGAGVIATQEVLSRLSGHFGPAVPKRHLWGGALVASGIFASPMRADSRREMNSYQRKFLRVKRGCQASQNKGVTSGEIRETSGEVPGTSGRSLGNFRGTPGLLFSSTVREHPGKSPKNFRGSWGNFRGSLGTFQKLGGA